MGYLTDNLVAQSAVFQSKIQMSLTKAVDAARGGPRDDLAKAVMQDLPRYAKELAPLFATKDNLNLDSTDGAIDAAVLANLDYLAARVLKA